MTKLWQKNWKLDPAIEAFETRGDLLVDQKLVKFDVLGSIAHIKMLNKKGLLSKEECQKAKKGFLKILKLNENGKFNLEFGDEDIHTKIENFLTENYGEVGKKIHTGRSRNDQVLTVLRLFTKEQSLLVWKGLFKLIESFLTFAKKYEFLPMPGYTHMQKAMPTTVGMWASGFAEGLLDDLTILKTAYQLNNQSPLGSAAGFGIPLPLDREYTAKLLGFSKVQVNSLYCQSSRGKIEALVLASLIAILEDINKFVSDVLLFTTSEFNFFEVVDQLCTGSSLMPQKKNLDVAELLRSKVHLLLGNYVQIISLSSNLISGYNRDLQDTKKPLFESFQIIEESLLVADILINNLYPKKDVLKKSLTPEIFATHGALALVKQGIPFREAYKQSTNKLSNLKFKNSEEILRQSTHLDGTGNLGIGGLFKTLKKEKKKFESVNENYLSTIKILIQDEKGGEKL